VHLEDVQTLNQWAIAGKMDISKISYGVLPLVLPQYDVLATGGALGKGLGPLLISREPISNLAEAIPNFTVAIPGVNTTAHLLFSMAFPQAHKKQFVVFNQVEELVLSGKVDAGVIIHENRFTYQQKGLVKLIDLGNYWEEKTHAPIPLGGIIIKNSFDDKLKTTVNRLIKESVTYAFANYPTLSGFVKQHAQEMNEDVMRKHIDLYVNDYSIDLGVKGELAVGKIMEVYNKVNPIQIVGPSARFIR
jgi:1,4-dihydroxy-6-naphthoate synthase